MTYIVYILKCADSTLYTGYTNNIEKRLIEHNGEKTGAKYTKARRPVFLAYSESFSLKGDAMRREIEIKKLSRIKKLELMQKQ